MTITTDICFSGCEVGFYGNWCEQCISPFYGEGCQFECKCLEKDCHHVYGCKKVFAGNVL